MASPRLFPALILVPCLTLVGIVAGLAVGSLVASGDGWDQLADTLGGMMLGALGGLVMAIVLVARLAVEPLRRIAWIALVLAVLGIGLLTVRHIQNRPEPSNDAPPSPTTKPVAPSG